jgi:hypothetical protein
MRYVTEMRTMPRGQKPEGEIPLSNAERQARYRSRRLKQPSPVVTRTRRPIDRRSGLQRWDDATNVLLVLQAHYVDWLTALLGSLRDTATAEALEAIADLDLTALAETKPPRGYGRD